MSTLANLCRHPVRVVTPATTIREAAEIMREQHIGALVVVAEVSDAPKPIGIVTDRDIVVAIVALDLNPNVFLVDDLLGRPLVVAGRGARVREGLELMKAHGVRRLPVVDESGVLTGIVTFDDALGEIAADMSRVSAVIEQEIGSELALRPGKIRARHGKRAKAAVA